MVPRNITLAVLAPLALTFAANPAKALQQGAFAGSSISHVVVPQTRGFAWQPGRPAVVIEAVHARVSILEQAASTTLDILLRNPGPRQAEAVLLLPVPDGAAVGAFTFQGAASEPTARVLSAEEARRIYDEIVRKLRDPALLEFAGYQLIRTSVFPVPPGGTQRVQLTFDHLLTADGDRVDYVLPRSESLEARVPWNVQVDLRSKRPISMVYSPSHDLVTRVREPHRRVFSVRAGGQSDPGSFRLSWLLQSGAVTASLLTYPDPEVGGGYFLLMAGLPAESQKAGVPGLKREVTVVLDRSGSMAGSKMDQARAAALQVIEGLEFGEAFNIIDYSSRVSSFAAAPVIKTQATTLEARRYLASLRTTGGTNLHDALLEALRQEPTPGTLPLILFLTDGLPTVGNTSEVAIRRVVETANPHGRRVFTFGVGNDVNVPLLDRISDVTRAMSTYVLPGEDVEVKVARVFRRLSGPVLADLELSLVDAQGALTTRRVRDILPGRLPDLFEGDQLVLLGQYREGGPLRFRLKGNFRGQQRAFAFDFEMRHASTQNAFVPRLWATRKIAFLVDQIRQAGAAQGGIPLTTGTNIFDDPRYAELAEEILRLSTRFGILSEYTAFLATEGSNLGAWDELLMRCNDNLQAQAVRTRHGEEAVNQGRNFNERKVQSKVAYDNAFWNAAGKRVQFTGVQQINDRAFFKRGTRWIDSDVISRGLELEVQETVVFGTPEHSAMVAEMVTQGRQGVLSLRGEILLRYRGKNVLLKND